MSTIGEADNESMGGEGEMDRNRISSAINKERTALRSRKDFCEEHYKDILPVIMDKIRRDKRKEVHARLDFGESPKKRRIREGSQNSSARTLSARAHSTDLVILTRQAQLNPDRTGQTSGIVLTIEAALTGGTLLAEIVLGAETAPAADRSRYVKRGRESESPLSCVSESGTSDGGHWKSRHKSTDEDDLAVPWIWPARVWFDELPLESIDGYKDLKASFLVYFMQQKKYVKDPVEIHNIKQRDEETIEKTSQSGMLQSGGLTFEVSQGKDEGLVGPYKNTQGNPRGQSGKVQTATTYGNPGREEKQQQVLRLP
ncbi:hypothetical protein Tco_0209012 [Tanacetum coccineum]